MLINPQMLSSPIVGESKLNGETWKFKRYLSEELNRYSVVNGAEGIYLVELWDYGSVSGLFDFGLQGQVYDAGSNKLYVLAEGVCLETDVLYDPEFIKNSAIQRFAFSQEDYVGGPFLDRHYFYAGLSDRIITLHNEGTIKAGQIIARGLVIFNGKRDCQDEESLEPDEIRLPENYWKNPETIVFQNEKVYCSYSPYQLKLSPVRRLAPNSQETSQKRDANFVRNLAYEAATFQIINWRKKCDLKSHMDEKEILERQKEFSYELLSLERLRPHFQEDSDGCFADYDIKKSRKIRKEIKTRAYAETYPAN
jgi:hypothetical protein